VKDTPRHQRARLGRATQLGDPAAIADAQADLRTVKAEKYIEDLVLAAPPLDAERRLRIAAILLAGRTSTADGGGLDAA
jgi:hypothetical protein